MTECNIVQLNSSTSDALGELLKQGAQQLLAQAIEAEVAALQDRYSQVSVGGRRAVVRNGYLPERTIQTGLGDIGVKVPKVRDRSAQGVKFNSQLIPPYLKRTKHLEQFIPWLYLKGISTGDMHPALEALLGQGALTESTFVLCGFSQNRTEESGMKKMRNRIADHDEFERTNFG